MDSPLVLQARLLAPQVSHGFFAPFPLDVRLQGGQCPRRCLYGRDIDVTEMHGLMCVIGRHQVLMVGEGGWDVSDASRSLLRNGHWAWPNPLTPMMNFLGIAVNLFQQFLPFFPSLAQLYNHSCQSHCLRCVSLSLCWDKEWATTE